MMKRSAAMLFLVMSAGLLLAEPPRVQVARDSPVPAAGASNVNPSTAVRVQFSSPVQPSSITPGRFRLLGPDGKPVPAAVNTDLTGGVATLTPRSRLQPEAKYTIELTDAILGQNGKPLAPFTSSFTTRKEKAVDETAFRFRASKLEDRDGVTSLAVGPDGHLYVADVFGHVHRYQLDEQGRAADRQTPVVLDGQQIIGICFDPRASAEKLLLWVSHARRDSGAWAGVVSRVEVPPVGSTAAGQRTDVIVGLPCPPGLEHQPNGIAFGPDGRLYQVVGGVATLGGDPNWGAAESPLSAAVLVADVNHPRFNDGKLPCNVQTAAPVNYDPRAPHAPVQVHATGLRNALDLCFHSNGHLYTATNGNSLGGNIKTPAATGVPAINARPHEFLCRVVPGKYYGHPNPSRGEFVLNGGNPTAGPDPWEVPEYPVGIQPEPNFDPSLLYDLRPSGGNSANGMAEYAGPGIKGLLRGRLLVAYFSGGRCIQTFAFAADGKVRDERPLLDPQGQTLRFNQPLDVAVDGNTGRIYVAVFGHWTGKGVASTGGGVWLLEPAAP